MAFLFPRGELGVTIDFNYLLMRPTKQIYANYTEEDFQVWKTLFNRQMEQLQTNVIDDYLKSLDKVGFTDSKIPDFIDLNKKLTDHTGWSLETVPNISAQKDFFNLLAQKKFTATCWLRTMAQLDYLEEPDMFHDVFGHTPLLSNKTYCDFFKKIGEIALKHIDNAEVIEKIGRIYWFTIEFGLMREKGKTKIYGAGIISSKGETQHALSNKPEKIDFDIF